MNPLRLSSSRSRQRMVGQGRSALTPSLPEQVQPPPPPSRPDLFQTPSRPSRPEIRTPSPPPPPLARAGMDAAATLPARSATVTAAPLRAATSPTLGSLEAAGFPAWWRSSSPSGSCQGMYPPGGFTSLLQSNNCPENSHLVGNTTNRTTISPTIARTPPADRNAQDKETIIVDEDDTVKDGRKEKRLNWTKDEDIRLASAWVHNSKDLVDGTDRKADQYWTSVTEEYNKSTEPCRKRNKNQLKIHWDRVKKPVSKFHGCWVQTNGVYRSGYSDQQLMEMAQKMYYISHNDKDFILKHIWRVMRKERKWSAYANNLLNKGKENNMASANKRAEVVNLDDNPNIRPIGHKKAKDERNGKRKTPEAYSAVSEKLDKFIAVTTMSIKDRDKMSEKQQQLTNSKVEAARLNDQAAEKQLKCKMLDTYRELLVAPTTSMNAAALAEEEST